MIANLKAGKRQTVVTYGTSLTSDGAWVDVLVAGASIFGTGDYQKTISALKAAANSN